MALNKVPMYQFFSNSRVHLNRGHDVIPRQAYDPGKKAMAPGRRQTYKTFVDNDLICSHQGKWGGGAQGIFSFLGRALQKIHKQPMIVTTL